MDKKSDSYYTLRSAVRFIFWGTVLAVIMWIITTSIAVFASDEMPDCDVTLERDFTWNAGEFAVLNPTKTLADCRHYQSVVLSEDGTWDWYDPYIDS